MNAAGSWTRWLQVGGLVAAMFGAGGSALAQEDGGTFGSFQLNSVLVAGFEADQPFLEAEAKRVEGLVYTVLGQSYIVQGMADVPAFTDYSADVYLQSCPDGQYIGCVFVIGGRAKTDWTVGGSVRAVDGGYQVLVSFIDVAQAKLVLEFDVVLDGSNDAVFQEGVLKVMDSLIAGEVQELDLLADAEAEAEAKRVEEERERAARQFAVDSAYEEDEVPVEDLRRGESGEDAEVSTGDGGRVTDADLEALEERGGITPWERAGLTRGQYRLYRNSGVKLRDFKERLRGRKGELLIRLSMQVNSGPWGQRHEMWYVQDNEADPNNIQAGDIPDQAAVQAQSRTLAFGGQFEIGVGVLPWLEIGLFGGIRQGTYDYRFYRELLGFEAAVPDLEGVPVRTYQGGLRIGAVPFPAYPFRPTFHVGGSYWTGTKLSSVVTPLPSYLLSSEMRPNNMVLLHVQPGAEVSLGKWVVLWTRFDLDIPILGRTSQVFNRGDGTLSARPDPTSNAGIGIGGSLGLMVRVRVGRR
jgi:hypothetical protein